MRKLFSATLVGLDRIDLFKININNRLQISRMRNRKVRLALLLPTHLGIGCTLITPGRWQI